MSSTPMSKLKPSLDQLERRISESFRVVSLNKSAAKPKIDDLYTRKNVQSETKGVQSDYIKIFHSQGDQKCSFAVVFTYLGLEECEHTVQVSVKISENPKEDSMLILSDQLGVEQAKEQLKSLLEGINSLPIDLPPSPTAVIERVVSEFLPKVKLTINHNGKLKLASKRKSGAVRV